MKVLNVHKRVIPAPKEEVAELLKTLATKDDLVWPHEKWPPMKFKGGLEVGNKGGHGPIRYSVVEQIPEESITFEFSESSGFNGKHWLEISALDANTTEIKHVIDMNPKWKAMLSWALGIRSLHDALIEDAFDKVYNRFSSESVSSEWNFWVKLLRKMLK